MNDNHWYPRDPQRYLTDTSWCDHATEVAHVRMIDTYYALGKPIADNMAEVQNIGKIKDADYSKVISNLIRLGWWTEAGFWRHKRIESTLVEMQTLREERSKAGKAGAEKRWQSQWQKDGKANGKTIGTTTTTTTTDTSTKTAKGKAPLSEILEAWNAIAPVRCLVMSDKRRHQTEDRWQDDFFREHWRSAIEIICASKFCCGDNDRGWKASYDWFVQPDTVAKAMEGKYGQKQPKSSKIAV